MLYDASEAHLFRCTGASWANACSLLVPNSFSTIGVTTPNKGQDFLQQGFDHLKGTDVCHVKYTGARLNCCFRDQSGSIVGFPPAPEYIYDTYDSYGDVKTQHGGDRYTVETTARRFPGFQAEWIHTKFVASLDWKTPARVSDWQWDYITYRYKTRRFTVRVLYDIYSTGWVTSSLDQIKKYPHHHYVEAYDYIIVQTYDDITKRTYFDNEPSDIQPYQVWPDLSNRFFKMNEKFYFVRDVCEWGPDTDLPWYRFHQGQKASAFLKAVEGFPTFDGNSWANLIEIIGILRDLKRGKFSEVAGVPEKWYEWWLQYRYRYTTTKGDIESMISLKKNLQAFHEAFGNYRRNVYGSFYDGETGITWRCEVQAVNRAASQIDQIYHGFATLGFGVSIYNLWDLVPFSFVVDWIYPVGDLAEALQQQQYLSSDYWDYESICYSATYEQGSNDGDFAVSATVYDRWYESSPPNLDQYYWFEEHSKNSSIKTGTFRLIDGLSLLVALRH